MSVYAGRTAGNTSYGGVVFPAEQVTISDVESERIIERLSTPYPGHILSYLDFLRRFYFGKSSAHPSIISEPLCFTIVGGAGRGLLGFPCRQLIMNNIGLVKPLPHSSVCCGGRHDCQHHVFTIGFSSKASRISIRRRLRACASLRLPRY